MQFAVEGILSNCGSCWPLREGDAGDPLEIIDKRKVMPRLEERGDGILLIMADFEG